MTTGNPADQADYTRRTREAYDWLAAVWSSTSAPGPPPAPRQPGRSQGARIAIGWPGEALRRVRLVFISVKQPPAGTTSWITWPCGQYVLGYRVKAPDQAPLSFRLDVPRLTDVLHSHGA